METVELGAGWAKTGGVKISVIVPAYNEEKLIAETLRQIKGAASAFSERGWEFELVVCDNNSSDRTAELARTAGATVVFEPLNQISRARNRGAAAATGQWLVFIDADSHPSRELFGDVAEAIQSGRYLAGGSTVEMDGDYPVAGKLVHFWNGLSRMLKWLAGSFIFVEARTFREAGGFSEELYVSEEIDLSRRLKVLARRRGQQMIILHRHPLRTSSRKLRLYSLREYLRFLGKTVWARGRTLKDPKACHPWYDGRR